MADLEKELPIMATDTQTITIEGFVTDLSFIDRSKAVSGVFTPTVGQVATLTAKVLSYFSDPVLFEDRRVPADRAVNWSPTVSPRLVIDKTSFGDFTTVLGNLNTSKSNGFFKLIDKLFFAYASSNTRPAIETFLTTDADIGPIYVADSFRVSQQLVSDTVYLENAGTKTVQVPSFIDFAIKLPSGSTQVTYVLKLYTSVEAWIAGYNISTIVKVIPPLPYDVLYDDSLVTSTDNVFSTASLTATLSYTTTEALLGTVSVSGIKEYKAILTDGVNKTTVPFNILYKGRKPTLFEIRTAIKQAIAASGVGDEVHWRKRIPGVYVEGRFYIIPFWDKTYAKPGQVVFPNILPYKDFATTTMDIVSSLGYGDITAYLDVFTLYYNRMSATAIPDLSGTVNVYSLAELIPDYQNCAPTDEQFSYMQQRTQDFSKDLNLILAVDSGVSSSLVYTPVTEGLLDFYSFTVDSYEICVITKQCYKTIMESIQ